MSSDLERIRALALKESARRADDVQKREAVFLVETHRLVKLHLPEWIKAIEKAVAAGQVQVLCDFNTTSRYLWQRWMTQSISSKVDLSFFSLQNKTIEIYGEKLQEILGLPFQVKVSFTDYEADHGWSNSYLCICWLSP